MNAYIRAMRLERWPRSVAIFVGSAAYFFLFRAEIARLARVGEAVRLPLAFLLTWMVSTANYVVNEIADAPFDVHHPTKRFRPLVRGEIRKVPFALIGALLAAAALAAAWIFFSLPFFVSLLGLLAAGFVYNIPPMRTKDIPFLDSVSESANNPIRFLIGWFAALTPAAPVIRPPLSLLLSWWAFGNFLMVAKRFSEHRFLKDKAGSYRQSHKAYSRTTLGLGLLASAAAFTAAFLYFALRFKLQSFLLLLPLLLLFFGLVYRKMLAERDLMEEPEHLLKNVPVALATLVLALLFILAFALDEVGR
jgi:decaprenyl-phosphate phosphoribosyltransferase